ncbi:DNA alkylation repair protein [Candidatus Viridilinea mediisalina]|uniref:DNA alkylation repair protein n=1 Tax=Candidatus Viridilinea mediisalina TaxID=2024553 RepID=A0A2A6RJN6_9CHLR|nr:DNA alkylation repair protein [Candidatus Viridilinea mediisalina]PDW03334.1 DNA alkylation repair protein [Candidatus Viridilinea mediisalina]
MMAPASPDAALIIARLESLASPDDAAGMARFGIRGSRVLGVPVKTLRAIARETGRNHAMAETLWASGIHEARILASIVAEPKWVDLAQMEQWVADLDSWDLCDQCCTNLWVRTPFARNQALVWSEREAEFVKRAGFVLTVQVAGKDKDAPAELLQSYLARAEQEAHDERNFVKKAVNWAIREIGQRSAELNAAAIAVAQRLQASDARTARWVGSDALRELTSAKVAQRVARRDR